MNGYALVILFAFLGVYSLNLVADILNLKVMLTTLPEEFKGTYDQEAYRKAQEYHQALTLWGIFKSTATLLVVLGIWFSGGFNFLDNLVRQFGFGSIVTGLLYIGSLVFLGTLLSLPFSIFETFYIEERFGFNRTRAVTFVLDSLTGWGLALLLGIPLFTGILYFFELAGPPAWWIGWMMVSLLLLLSQWIGPTWIMPLFNRFFPIENGELKEAILAYGKKINFPIENINVMDGSKRSSKGNAFFTGFGRRKRIALFDTLIEKQTVAELVAVLAHEIGHYKKRHILTGIIFSILNTGILFFILSFFITQRGLNEAFYLEHPSLYANLVFFSFLYVPIEFIFSIFFLILCRRNENEADRFAAETLSDPESMVKALKKLAVDNLANLTPHPLHLFLNDSHPSLLERIRNIRETVKPA
ncbi:MAG: M48 family metallopeptidase [Nitrospiria bacterium]